MWRWAMITEKPQCILSSYRNPPRGCGIISRRFLTLESSEKFRAPGENQTHDPLSFSSDTLATELLDALWRAGSKFNHNYTSHERDEDSCLLIQCRSMGRASPAPPQKKKKIWQARFIWSAATPFTLLLGWKCSFQFDKAWKLFIYGFNKEKLSGY